MQSTDPALLELAQRLRRLRQEHWPDVRLTQDALAKALGGSERLASATVSSWESLTAPKLPPRDRLLAYARFFATRRSIEEEPQLLPLDTLSREEQAAYEGLAAELLGLRNAASRLTPGESISVRRSWYFSDPGPVTLVCAQLPKEETGPLADPSHPNFNELLSYADLDALMELRGHIRAENPAMDVYYKTAPNVAPDDLSGHVILIGGIGWNDITKRLSAMTSLPVRQVDDPTLTTGEIFIVETDGKEQKFLPTWEDGDRAKPPVEDVGLLVRMPNPLNSSRTLTICNGVHSRGVFGGVRTLTDARLRESNEGYITRSFGNAREFAILMRVQVIEEKTMTPDFNIPGTVLYQWSKDAQR